jgi:hypothetical protein
MANNNRAPTIMAPSSNYIPLIPNLATHTQFAPIYIEKPVIYIPNLQILKRDLTISSNLADKLAGDVAVGCGVTFVVAPFIGVVDKAIVQRAAGTHSMVGSGIESISNMARNPIAYIKSPTFLLMWGVYAATYSTANSLKTIMEHREYYRTRTPIVNPTATTSSNVTSANNGKLGVFLGTAVVNSSTSLFKDRAFARMFGTSGAATSIPMVTFGLWAARDCLVIGSSFILPDIMAKKLVDDWDIKKSDAQKISQLSLPVATQFLAGPIQLLGLDFYNRPLANHTFREAVMDRTRFLIQGYFGVVAARIARIAPGYGIGGIYNTQFRDQWREHLIEKEIMKMNENEASASHLVNLVTERHSS